ncbi:MAG: CHAT domain-containing protein, partial [Chitinophagales bacterium]
DEDDLKDLGAQLYEQLLEPVLLEEPHCEQLVVIPDDCLHRLPFDVLVRQTMDGGRQTVDESTDTYRRFSKTSLQNTQTPKHKQYLIEAFQISYHYSATLWFEDQKNKVKANRQDSFLGIAPINFDNTNPDTYRRFSKTSLQTPENKKAIFKSDFNANGKLKELLDSKIEIQKIHNLFTQHKLPSTPLL